MVSGGGPWCPGVVSPWGQRPFKINDAARGPRWRGGVSRCPGSYCFLSKVSVRGVTWWLVVSGAARWWRVLSGGGSIDKF